MNWNYWLPWRDYPEKDSSQESQVVDGEGPKRVLVNKSEQEPPFGTTD